MNQSINTDSKNSKEPQQKYRLVTVSIKAKKHRVLSYKEIFQLHLYFTLNIAIFAYLIFLCNCMH